MIDIGHRLRLHCALLLCCGLEPHTEQIPESEKKISQLTQKLNVNKQCQKIGIFSIVCFAEYSCLLWLKMIH